jgi:hypothetical protein
MLAAIQHPCPPGRGVNRGHDGKIFANVERTEERMTTKTRSAFVEVLAALMEEHGITARPGNMFELASEARLDPGAFMARVSILGLARTTWKR